MRGPGKVLATRQTGEMQLRIADLVKDQGMLDEVPEAAEMMLRTKTRAAERLVDHWLGERTDYDKI